MHAVWLLLPNCTLQHDAVAASPLHSAALLREMGFVCTMHSSVQSTRLPLFKEGKKAQAQTETNCAYKYHLANRLYRTVMGVLSEPQVFLYQQTSRLHWRGTQNLVSLILSHCEAPLLFFSQFFFLPFLCFKSRTQ